MSFRYFHITYNNIKMRNILLFIFFLSLCSCNTTHYFTENSSQTSGIDFSKGKWLLGDIEADAEIKEEITKVSLNDFSEHLKNRITYYLDNKSLLIPQKINLKPNRTTILDLKKGTNYDFYINIKCEDERNDLTNFNVIDHAYYKKQMTFARVTIEVYDLNKGEITYSQSIIGSIDEFSSVTFKPKHKVIMGCYKKLINQINKKSIKITN